MTNSRIIEQIKDDNHHDALATLYKTAYPTIRNYILKNNGNLETVKDVFHEAIIVLIETIRNNSFDESREVNAFLFSVARNKWISTLRKDQSSSKYIAYKMKEETYNEETSHDILLQKEMRSEMKSVLDKLQDHCQKILELFIYQNKSMDEIAEKMGYSSRNAVKTAHYKCKKKLKEFILQSEKFKELLLQ